MHVILAFLLMELFQGVCLQLSQESSYLACKEQPTICKTLILKDLHLAGSIPIDFGQLTQITHIDLSENQLTGTVPSELGNLKLLTELALEFNGLTGSLPPELANASSLHSLRVQGNAGLCGDLILLPASTAVPLNVSGTNLGQGCPEMAPPTISPTTLPTSSPTQSPTLPPTSAPTALPTPAPSSAPQSPPPPRPPPVSVDDRPVTVSWDMTLETKRNTARLYQDHTDTFLSKASTAFLQYLFSSTNDTQRVNVSEVSFDTGKESISVHVEVFYEPQGQSQCVASDRECPAHLRNLLREPDVYRILQQGRSGFFTCLDAIHVSSVDVTYGRNGSLDDSAGSDSAFQNDLNQKHATLSSLQKLFAYGGCVAVAIVLIVSARHLERRRMTGFVLLQCVIHLFCTLSYLYISLALILEDHWFRKWLGLVGLIYIAAAYVVCSRVGTLLLPASWKGRRAIQAFSVLNMHPVLLGVNYLTLSQTDLPYAQSTDLINHFFVLRVFEVGTQSVPLSICAITALITRHLEQHRAEEFDCFGLFLGEAGCVGLALLSGLVSVGTWLPHSSRLRGVGAHLNAAVLTMADLCWTVACVAFLLVVEIYERNRLSDETLVSGWKGHFVIDSAWPNPLFGILAIISVFMFLGVIFNQSVELEGELVSHMSVADAYQALFDHSTVLAFDTSSHNLQRNIDFSSYYSQAEVGSEEHTVFLQTLARREMLMVGLGANMYPMFIFLDAILTPGHIYATVGSRDDGIPYFILLLILRRTALSFVTACVIYDAQDLHNFGIFTNPQLNIIVIFAIIIAMHTFSTLVYYINMGSPPLRKLKKKAYRPHKEGRIEARSFLSRQEKITQMRTAVDFSSAVVDTNTSKRAYFEAFVPQSVQMSETCLRFLDVGKLVIDNLSDRCVRGLAMEPQSKEQNDVESKEKFEKAKNEAWSMLQSGASAIRTSGGSPLSVVIFTKVFDSYTPQSSPSQFYAEALEAQVIAQGGEAALVRNQLTSDEVATPRKSGSKVETAEIVQSPTKPVLWAANLMSALQPSTGVPSTQVALPGEESGDGPSRIAEVKQVRHLEYFLSHTRGYVLSPDREGKWLVAHIFLPHLAAAAAFAALLLSVVASLWGLILEATILWAWYISLLVPIIVAVCAVIWCVVCPATYSSPPWRHSSSRLYTNTVCGRGNEANPDYVEFVLANSTCFMAVLNEDYFKSLWCVYELATFIRLCKENQVDPSDRITFLSSNWPWIQKKQLPNLELQIVNFKCNNAHCYLPKDHAALLQHIRLHFSSEEQFDQFVHANILQLLRRNRRRIFSRAQGRMLFRTILFAFIR